MDCKSWQLPVPAPTDVLSESKPSSRNWVVTGFAAV